MATKITELDELVLPSLTDIFPIVNGGDTKKVKLLTVKETLGINNLNTRLTVAETSVGTLANLTTTEKTNLVGAINEVEARVDTAETDIDKLENVTKYITATATTNGDFKINIINNLATNMILNINFPTATNGASNARLSIDNGVTYKNIFMDGLQCLAKSIMSKSFILRYDGTQWKISDGVYSTTETVVGTWTDGKPIYRKVYNIGSLPNNTTTFYSLGITGFGELIKLMPKWFDTNDGLWLSNFRFDSTTVKITFFINPSTSQLQVEGIGTNWSTRTSGCTVILEYTKSSD